VRSAKSVSAPDLVLQKVESAEHSVADGDADGDGDGDTDDCFTGDYTIASRKDAFLLKPYRCIDGNLEITGLAHVTSVGGDLRVGKLENPKIDGTEELPSCCVMSL
jgi:hypothetical protein